MDAVFKALADPSRRKLLGREKLHYLNLVAIQEIYDRWLSKYERHQLDALSQLKRKLEGNTKET